LGRLILLRDSKVEDKIYLFEASLFFCFRNSYRQSISFHKAHT
jgi:hypothetical protein